MERAYLSTAGLTVSPAVLRQVRGLTKQLEQQEHQYGQRAHRELSRLREPRAKVLGWSAIVQAHYRAIDAVESELFNLYRSVIEQNPAGAIMHRNMLDQAAHDLAHLDEDCGFIMQTRLEEGIFDPQQVEPHVNRLMTQAEAFFHFRNYPLYLMAALLQQYAGKQPTVGTVKVSTSLHMVALSQFFRSLFYPALGFSIEPYSTERAQDPAFTGILLDVEPDLVLRTIEPYLVSMVFNLAKNFFGLTLWDQLYNKANTPEQQKSLRGAKFIFSARRHPQLPEVTVLEAIDNGPGFDLKKIFQQVLSLTHYQEVIPGLPTEVFDQLQRLNGSPYATQIIMGEIMESIFLHRLSGKRGQGLHSGLGLFGAANFRTQMHGALAVGTSFAKSCPFSSGARFMLLLPTNIFSFMPDLNLIIRDVKYGTLRLHFEG